jgi:hypothetical protein
MARIALLCGKVCSGKSTFRERLERERGFMGLEADEWMLRLYGEGLCEPARDRAVFDRRLAACTALLHDLAERMLTCGVDVAIDTGFWTRGERAAARARFGALGHETALVFFDVGFETQVARAKARQAAPGARHYEFDEGAITELNALFEPIGAEEGAARPEAYIASLAPPRPMLEKVIP